LILKIVLVVGPLLAAIYFWAKPSSVPTKIIVSIICIPALIAGVWLPVKETAERKEQDEASRYDRELLERQELRGQGFPTAYIDGLGENPLLKHHFNEGQRYEKEYKFEEAIEEFNKCLSHPGATEENRVAANILIGNCYYAQSRFKEAEEHYRGALDISKRVKDKSEALRGRAVALGNIGVVLHQKGHLEGALEYYRKALKIHEKIGNLSGMASDYGNIGLILEQKGDLEGAIGNHREALKMFESLGDLRGAARSYGNIGNALVQAGDLDGALKNHRKSLDINEGLRDLSEMAKNYNNIGVVVKEKGQFEEALKSHMQALRINKSIGRRDGIAINYCNIGNVLALQGNLDAALESYREDLIISQEIGQPEGIARAHINMGSIHYQKGLYKSAALLQFQGLSIYSQIGMKPHVEKAQRHLAISVRKLRDQGKFEEFLQEAKDKFGEEVEKLLGGLFTADEAD